MVAAILPSPSTTENGKQMKTIDLVSPVTIDDVVYNQAKISPINFKKFANYATEASSENAKFQVTLRRVAMKGQVVLVNGDKTAALTDASIQQLPFKAGKQLSEAAIEDGSPSGKIVSPSENDGTSKSIVYRLATPLKFGNAKPIEEIEFLANTYGELEMVLVEENQLMKTLKLIETVARPAGMLALPSWAVDALTVGDGVGIMKDVAPSFLN
jgi:hypothetical protein